MHPSDRATFRPATLSTIHTFCQDMPTYLVNCSSTAALMNIRRLVPSILIKYCGFSYYYFRYRTLALINDPRELNYCRILNISLFPVSQAANRAAALMNILGRYLTQYITRILCIPRFSPVLHYFDFRKQPKRWH